MMPIIPNMKPVEISILLIKGSRSSSICRCIYQLLEVRKVRFGFQSEVVNPPVKGLFRLADQWRTDAWWANQEVAATWSYLNFTQARGFVKIFSGRLLRNHYCPKCGNEWYETGFYNRDKGVEIDDLKNRLALLAGPINQW
jgi:hypothetical protein